MSYAVPCHGNPLLCTDSYKVTHYAQYPPKTSKVFSYFEARGGKFKETTFFGLQYIIKNWMTGAVVTEERISEAKEFYDKHFMSEVFHEAGWRHILEKHGGKLPLIIRAVPEGTTVPVKNVLFTVENTDPECYWLTTWFETVLVQVWYPLTVCSTSRYQKVVLKDYLAATEGKLDKLPFQLHDFGFRGVSSTESAAIGGAAHLVNFMGSDTVAALQCARDVYGLSEDTVAGFSIPASEHSTITSWGTGNELNAFDNMLEKFPKGLVACVSDSENIWLAIKDLWGGKLKAKVEGRDGTLVVRPDSGHPPEVVVKCLELLGAAFGTTKNEQGFKVLPPYVRLIQGDGIDLPMLTTILQHIHLFGWSTDMLAFGSGGGLLQKMDRDTCKCAYKCSWIEVDGVARDVSKNPITDKGKKSKKGRLTLENNDGVWTTIENGDPAKDQLVTVFENGELVKEYSYDDIRKRADVGEPTPVPAFVSSEKWVADMGEWGKEYGITIDTTGLYKASEENNMPATLEKLQSMVSDSMAKEELVTALQALNKLNSKLLEVAKKSASESQ